MALTSQFGELNYPNKCVMNIFFNGKEILVPFDEELIESIDMSRKRIDIHLPEGLIEPDL